MAHGGALTARGGTPTAHRGSLTPREGTLLSRRAYLLPRQAYLSAHKEAPTLRWDSQFWRGAPFLSPMAQEAGGEFRMSPKYGGYFIWPESLRLECVLVPTRNRIGVERTPTASRPNSERVPWKSWGLRRAPQQPQVLAEGRARTECRPNLCRLTTRCRHSLAARLDEGRYAVTGRPLTEDSPLHPYGHGVQSYGRCIQAYDGTVQSYYCGVQPYGCFIPPFD